MKKYVDYVYDFFKNNNILKLLSILLFVLSIYYIRLYVVEYNLKLFFTFNSYLIISIILFTLCNIIYSFSWSFLLSDKYLDTNLISNWLISIAGKYIPFKIGIPLLRKTTSKDQNIKILRPLILEQLIILFVSFVFGLLYFLPGRNLSIILLIILFISSFFILLSSKNKSLTLFSRDLRTYTNYLLGQYFLLFGLFYIADNNFNFENLELVFSYFLSSLVSMLAVAVPAGIGLRESLAIAILDSNLNPQVIINFLINVRVALLFSDLISVVIGFILRIMNINENKT